MKLGFIGTGNITVAVVNGICRSKIAFKKILVSSRNKNKAIEKLKKYCIRNLSKYKIPSEWFVTNYIEKNDITSLVLGLPLNKDGTKGPSAQSAITFASILHKNFNLPTLLWDERFSTIGIKKEMKKNGVKRDKIEKHYFKR